jgi:hypothetical protein
VGGALPVEWIEEREREGEGGKGKFDISPLFFLVQH